MSGNIYLIGGGELKNGETRLIDEDILSLSTQGSVFVFFGFGSGDNNEYANTIISVYGSKFKVIVPTESKGKDFTIDAIKSASIIYLGGGNADQLLRVFAEWGLVEHLTAAINRGAHVAGMSAGAQALAAQYIDEDNGPIKLREGWGIVPFCVIVHTNQTSFKKAKLLWSEGGMTRPLIAVGESAAWRICTTNAEKIGRGKVWTATSEYAIDLEKQIKFDKITGYKLL